MGDAHNPGARIAAPADLTYARAAGVDLNKPAYLFGKTRSNDFHAHLEYVVIAQTQEILEEVLEAKAGGKSPLAAKVKRDMSTVAAQPLAPDLEDVNVIKTCCSASRNVAVLFAGMVQGKAVLAGPTEERFVLAIGRRGAGGKLRRLREVVISDDPAVLNEFHPSDGHPKSRAATAG
jgi:hypothetical protein